MSNLTLEQQVMYNNLPDVDRVKYRNEFKGKWINIPQESFDLLIGQFKESENLLGIMNVVAFMKQQLDDATINLARYRLIDTATGANLDIIGEELGVPRNNSPDEEFRILLKIRAYRTRLSGTRPEVIDVVSRSVGIDKKQIRSYLGLNKSFDLAFPIRSLTRDTLREELRKMFPLVSNFRLVNTPETEPVFGFKSLKNGQSIPQVKGFGSIYDKGNINNSAGLGEGFLGGRLSNLIGSSSLVAD